MKRNHIYKTFYCKNKLFYLITIIILIINSVLVIGISTLLQEATDIAMYGELQNLSKVIIVTLFVIATLTVNWVIERTVRNGFIKKAITQYKSYVFEKISQKNISLFMRENTGGYISALTNDVTSVETNYLQGNFELLLQFLNLILAFVAMIWYSWIMTCVVVILGVLPLFASMIFGGKLTSEERKVSNINEKYVSMIKDLLSGFTVIKSFKAEREMTELFNAKNNEVELQKCRRRRAEALINLIASSLGLIAQIGMILLGVYFIMIDKISMGVLVAFVQLMGIALTPIQSIPKLLANRKAAKGLIDKIADTLDSNQNIFGESVVSDIGEGIVIENLSFGYDSEKKILNGIDLRIESGKSYAIVGGSGAGKSTLINLMLGAFDTYKGSIKIGGCEVKTINPDCLYDVISIVQQNVFIFDSSIKDNITMFREFPDEEIKNVIRIAGLEKLVYEKGMEYQCGENGNGLSGGEKQRISIARAFLRKTPILIMDETTAALDKETAYNVETAVLNIDKLTKIMVTHKYEDAIMELFDEVVVLKHGKIVERGKFRELLAQKSYFYSLYNVSNGGME